MFIILAALFYNIFMLHCFNETKVNGFQGFSYFILFLTILAMMSSVAINIKLKQELDRKEGSQLFKIYFTLRVLFVTCFSLYLFVCVGMVYFFLNFESINVDEDVKISILNSFELMPYSLAIVFSFTLFAAIVGTILLTHQIFWS